MLFAQIMASYLAIFQVGPLSKTETPWIDVSFADGRCIFMTGDAEYNVAQLVSDLQNYEIKGNIDLAVQPNTPDRCVRKARVAARRAGFAAVGLKPYDTVPDGCLPVQCAPGSVIVTDNDAVEAPRQ